MIKQSVIENVLEAALSTGGDFSEVFIEDKFVNECTLQSGKIEQSISGRDFGIGAFFPVFRASTRTQTIFQRKAY